MLRSRARLSIAVSLMLCAVACGAPPDKELHQAQGAIDAARAAGAEAYATNEFTGAVDALKKAEEAVAQRDYRLALNYALDSRERAQNAAKLAVDGRADARGQAERSIAEADTLLNRAQAELKAADLLRVNAKLLRSPRQTVAAADKALQEARTALKAEDYQRVAGALNGVAATLQAALSEIDAATSPRPPARKR